MICSFKKAQVNCWGDYHQGTGGCPSCPAPAAPSLSLGPPGQWRWSQKRRSQTLTPRDSWTSPPLHPAVAGRHKDTQCNDSSVDTPRRQPYTFSFLPSGCCWWKPEEFWAVLCLQKQIRGILLGCNVHTVGEGSSTALCDRLGGVDPLLKGTFPYYRNIFPVLSGAWTENPPRLIPVPDNHHSWSCVFTVM